MALLFLSALAVVLLDQWTKNWVQSRVVDRTIDFGPVAIRHVPSERKMPSPFVLVLVLTLSFACAVALMQSGEWFQQPSALSALGVAFGGAASNVADLARRNHVVDFIDLGWWPVFNLADVGIVAGLVVAFWPAW